MVSDVDLRHGDCLNVMREMPDCSVDAVVTDPPYGLGFMGKAWDSNFEAADMPMRRNGAQDAVNAGAARQGGRQRAGDDYQRRMARDSRAYQDWCELWAAECLRLLKPGGHMLAFGGTRTWHRLCCAVEDAGFEIRDNIAWLYGSGFPKSRDVSKAIDAEAGATREVVGASPFANRGRTTTNNVYSEATPSHREVITAPATDAAKQWAGWGTAMKPAFEPIVVARKPLSGTVAANVQQWGTGALNIDGCRIGLHPDEDAAALTARSGGVRGFADEYVGGTAKGAPPTDMTRGRWPANVVLDQHAAAALDRQSGVTTSIGKAAFKPRSIYQSDAEGYDITGTELGYGDTGGASRFMYVAKADTHQRPKLDGQGHPTVKPLDLIRWLTRLVTPPGGVVLDPFLGSGTTAEACIIEHFRCTGIDQDEQSIQWTLKRLAKPIAPVLDFDSAGNQ